MPLIGWGGLGEATVSHWPTVNMMEGGREGGRAIGVAVPGGQRREGDREVERWKIATNQMFLYESF